MAAVAEILADAKEQHRVGQLRNAVQLYRQVLQVDAANCEALYLLGAACHALGELNESLSSLAEAIRLKPDFAEAYNHLGSVLARQGKLEEAISSFEQACRLQPGSAEVSNNLRGALAAKQNRQGNRFAAQGNFDEARACYQRALDLKPDFAEAHNNLGMALAKQDRLADAVACYRRALQLMPDYAKAHHNLGLVLAKQGQSAEAADCYRRALDLKPNFAEALNNLGTVLEKLDRAAEAAVCYQRALELKPDYATAHHNLGTLLAMQEKLDEAAACCRRSVELKPDSAEAHNCLGTVLSKQGLLDEATSCYRRALELKPNYAEAHHNLGAVLAKQRQSEEAAACYLRALKLKPDFAESYNNLALVLTDQNKLDEAAACCRWALELKPDFAEAYNNLGAVLAKQERPGEAAACCRRALELKPDLADAHNNLGHALTHQGRIDDAMACYRRALEIQPQSGIAHSNLLLVLQYQPDVTLRQLAAAHNQYDDQQGALLRPTWRPHANDQNPERRLRLGFVSADFGFHPVGYFLIRVLENLDQRQAETICYCDRSTADAMTARLQAAATSWRDVRALSDQQLADQIRADRIDILFDLAGHTGNNRLLCFARKPAPIQITWIGYVGTTGLKAMDYLLADGYEVPVAAERYIQERVVRMPDGYVCYDPPSHAPPVSPLPALERGYVTFGSFNNPAKLTVKVIEVWARILRQAAGARLVLKYRGLDDRLVRQRLVGLFVARDVAATRLEILGSSRHEELLRHYQGIDVALDPFPYNGGLTTCEAMWMGVPVVACPGETFASRHSLSHLSNVGLTETIASDLECYVDLTLALAADLPRLADIRARLRQQMAASPLCDGKRFADSLITVLRSVWGRWCP